MAPKFCADARGITNDNVKDIESRKELPCQLLHYVDGVMHVKATGRVAQHKPHLRIPLTKHPTCIDDATQMCRGAQQRLCEWWYGVRT